MEKLSRGGSRLAVWFPQSPSLSLLDYRKACHIFFNTVLKLKVWQILVLSPTPECLPVGMLHSA